MKTGMVYHKQSWPSADPPWADTDSTTRTYSFTAAAYAALLALPSAPPRSWRQPSRFCHTCLVAPGVAGDGVL